MVFEHDFIPFDDLDEPDGIPYLNLNSLKRRRGVGERDEVGFRPSKGTLKVKVQVSTKFYGFKLFFRFFELRTLPLKFHITSKITFYSLSLVFWSPAFDKRTSKHTKSSKIINTYGTIS